ncbi:BrnT family toxin [Candidatus Thiosymbion oneisti]|uniref:BrnT family toxin n=1 Tax=Candidatus Thiosymbion oneisti TaxID=589554 RepID=UPI00105D1FFE|nr:BrnT family toxin [Candidatus Thiosymbion oneisti]
MDFRWNPQKADINSKKHGVSFEEASTVFGDTLSTTYPDPEHSVQEERYVIIGLSSGNRILVISHAYRGETIRIISARQATKREQNFYEYGI